MPLPDLIGVSINAMDGATRAKTSAGDKGSGVGVIVGVGIAVGVYKRAGVRVGVLSGVGTATIGVCFC